MDITLDLDTGKGYRVSVKGDTYEDFKVACHMLRDITFPEVHKEDLILLKTLEERMCQNKD